MTISGRFRTPAVYSNHATNSTTPTPTSTSTSTPIPIPIPIPISIPYLLLCHPHISLQILSLSQHQKSTARVCEKKIKKLKNKRKRKRKKKEDMKEELQPPPVHHHHRRHIPAFTHKKLAKPTVYVVLLLLSYSLGYLSNSQKYYSPIIAQTENASAPAPADNDHYRFSTQCADPVPSKLVRPTILDRVFNGTSPFDNFPPAHASSLLRPKRIKGWGSYGAVFDNLIRKVHPKTIIEVGTFLGASAIHMAELASGLGLKTQILCVDDFRGWPGFRDRFRDIKMVNGDVLLLYQFMQNVVHVNANDSILFVPFSTGSALQKLCEWGVFGDLIEVDAGHDFHSAWSDINRAYKLLRPGGVIFGHDYFTSADNKGVRRAVNLFARVNGLRVQIDGQHWVIESI